MLTRQKVVNNAKSKDENWQAQPAATNTNPYLDTRVKDQVYKQPRKTGFKFVASLASS